MFIHEKIVNLHGNFIFALVKNEPVHYRIQKNNFITNNLNEKNTLNCR